MIVYIPGYLNKHNVHRAIATVNTKKVYEIHFKFLYQSGDDISDIPYIDCINEIYFNKIPSCLLSGFLLDWVSIKLPMITRTKQTIIFNQDLILECTMFLKVDKLYDIGQKNLAYCPDVRLYIPVKYTKWLMPRFDDTSI